MKTSNFLAASALALFGFALAASPARALTYTSDDVLLGFYATGGQGSSESLVINLGQASVFRDFTGGFFDLSIGNIGADLVAVYGADWNTRADLKWGVFATTYNAAVGSDPVHTLYATKAQSTVGTSAIAYNLGSAATQSQAAAKIYSVGTSYATGTATTNSAVATIQDASVNNDFAQWQTNSGAASFGYFNGALDDFGNGTGGTALDFFRMQTGSSSAKGTYEGTFTISNAGVVRFSVVAVPEPSTGMLVMVATLGAVAFVYTRYRRWCSGGLNVDPL